jgi:nucleoside-diphosphate-sugar epimerase
MANVLVTGGAGFIGSHLAAALHARGDKVRIFDNFSSGSRSNLSAFESQVEVINGDLRLPKQISDALNGIETIFHQAAFVSVPESIENPTLCYETNLNGTINLLEAARAAGCRRVVLASSAAVYGANPNVPLTESASTECLSPYAASKLFNETLAQLYSRAFGLPIVALRYFNVFGPRQLPSSSYAAAIPKFISAIRAGKPPTVYGDGKQRRDFVYVGDVVRANLLAAETEHAGQVFNVCSGQETSLLDLLAALAEIIPGSPSPVFAPARLGDVARSLGDPSRAAEQLKFKAQTSLREGLRQTAEASQ